MSDLYLIFNHQLTTIQEEAATSELGIAVFTGLRRNFNRYGVKFPRI